jgi:hypothetical protein
MRGSCDVSVGQDGQQLRGCATKNSGRIDIAHGTGECGCHRLEGFLGRARAVGLDQQHSEVALVSVCARQLVLEYGANKAIVEQPGGAIDDMERFGLWVIGLDAA